MERDAESARWWHTAQLLWLGASVGSHGKSRLKPADFHPLERRTEGVVDGTIEDLKLFVGAGS